MIVLEGFEFPETIAEASTWEGSHTHTALHPNVMVFATTRMERTWAAYIFPVSGLSHRDEWKAWKVDGIKLSESVAKAIFPNEFRKLPYCLGNLPE